VPSLSPSSLSLSLHHLCLSLHHLCLSLSIISVYLSPSLSLPRPLSVYLSVSCLSLFVYLSISLTISLSLSLSFYLSLFLWPLVAQRCRSVEILCVLGVCWVCAVDSTRSGGCYLCSSLLGERREEKRREEKRREEKRGTLFLDSPSTETL